jgi:hypothetical protein
MEQVYALLDDSDAVEDYELQREAEDPIDVNAMPHSPSGMSWLSSVQQK